MQRTRLGRSNVEVTALGFGGAPLGNLYEPLDPRVASDAVDAAWAAGIRYFDTAPHYGLGLSELRLGALLASRPRDQYSISTKVGRLLLPNPAPTGSDLRSGGFAVDDALTRQWDFSRDGVRRSLDASMQRLNLDKVDIVYVHDPDAHLDDAIDHAIPALLQLRDEAVIGAVGAAMNSVDPLRRIVAETRVDVIMVAGRWTLIDRTAEQLLDHCAHHGVSVVAAAPFNSGLLADPAPSDDARFDYRRVSSDLLATARAAAEVCSKYGTTLPHAAMQFPLSHPAVACVLAGMRTSSEVTQDAAWMTTDLPPGLFAGIDAETSR